MSINIAKRDERYEKAQGKEEKIGRGHAYISS